MNFRRRPILKSAYKLEPSLRYEIILNGSVVRYHDGREVCTDSKAGWIEYKRRVQLMWQRQDRKCCLCGKPLALANATFEHQRRRGMGSAWRNDAVELPDGTPTNGAAHWICNVEKG